MEVTGPQRWRIEKKDNGAYSAERAPLQEEHIRNDEGQYVVVWELARPNHRDGRVVETNQCMSYTFASNTNAQLLGAESSGVVRYVVGYCSKNPTALANVLATVRHVMLEEPRRVRDVMKKLFLVSIYLIKNRF